MSSLARNGRIKWTVNIEHATLEGLKSSIRAMYQTPALENDGAVLNMLNDSGKYSPRIDQDLREMLQLFKNNLKFTVFIETPSKPFLIGRSRRCVSFMVLANQTILYY